MTVWVFLAICLVLLTTGFVVSPLFRASANQVLGRGVESDDPVTRWQAEKDRLTGQLRENDMALAEGRIDGATHGQNNRRLAVEADAALGALHRVREALGAAQSHETIAPGRATSALAALCVVVAAFAVSWVASWNNLDMRVSPHADGRIPLEQADGAPVGVPMGMPATADGAPDVEAMVARLETRVWDGDATPEDFRMLLRSYGVLGREEDAPDVLKAAARQFPDDQEFHINYLRMVIETPDAPPATELLPIVNEVLAATPDMAEARWYRSLLNLQIGQTQAAKADLEWLALRLAPEHPAAERVRDMLAKLAIADGNGGEKP